MSDWHDQPWYDVDTEPEMDDWRCREGHHTAVQVIALQPTPYDPRPGVLAWECSWCGIPLYAVPRIESVKTTGGVL